MVLKKLKNLIDNVKKANKLDYSSYKFTISKEFKFVQLPINIKREEIDIEYDLIQPFAKAHIYYDENDKELIYEVIEPVLTEHEKDVLKKIIDLVEENINISLTKIKTTTKAINYLVDIIKSILEEAVIYLSQQSFEKIMYYIYRDIIGLGKIEPLMQDYYIEDIECNGVGFNIYIMHRLYGSIKTNIVYDSIEELANFVEKLALRTDRYVSYANPILDGSLPDGTRVNATYTKDITTRGPTFTLRKFTKEPFTPSYLILNTTTTAEIFAYLWLAIENRFNIMIIGETASGKTSFLNSILHFVPPNARICSIEDTREINIVHSNWLPAVTRAGYSLSTVGGKLIGEVSLYELLRETFRQNPDYVVVGEVRGAEAYVLFQGMASGHASLATFHANSVETVVKRLVTPPINLPASLVESLDIVVVMAHLKGIDINLRKTMQVDEIVRVNQDGKVEYNIMFKWNPKDNIFYKNSFSYILKRMADRIGVTEYALANELRLRSMLLYELAKRNIIRMKDFMDVIKEFYRDKNKVLKEFGII